MHADGAPVKFNHLSQNTRRRLIQMACVAAWSDMDIADEEREAVRKLAHSMDFSEEDMKVVEEWLKRPPPEFDPYDIPREHRKLFLDSFVEIIESDGRIDPEESESIRLLRELVE
jgi:uncharacterized tellurite resistance protein B-like protein